MKKDKDTISIVDQKQIEKKTIFLGSEILRSGHRCFEINIITNQASEAKYESVVNFNTPNTRKILIKKNCVYVNALNSANALKVYSKGGRKEIKPIFTKADL